MATVERQRRLLALEQLARRRGTLPEGPELTEAEHIAGVLRAIELCDGPPMDAAEQAERERYAQRSAGCHHLPMMDRIATMIDA